MYAPVAALVIGLPFGIALELEVTVLSVSPRGWMVLDCGLKSLGMDHGEPTGELAGRLLRG